MILIDTDHLSVLTEPRHLKRSVLLEKLRESTDTVCLPVVCLEEQLRGWLAQIRRSKSSREQVVPYLRLAKVVEFYADWPIVSWSVAAADILDMLRSKRIRIGTQDLMIAAIALANEALLLSANQVDFEQVPDLRVEDWLNS